ncbi:phage tail tape measure protein [Marinobacter sp. TBZ242]|uniref:Phage tail tape measure protein n=1 Tax=Marinobacter azerbaijanicus TaxID=3050455 RepID=A0ABT7IAJ5_9GAMM|nr:phage tail tape measure protein [Marinobacter sp. TBZ242]MDL0430218.1 phage tail tape measure protein [Marinobacter sp. TBZ242]
MADTSKTVEIIFGGVDRTGSAVNSVGKNLDGLTNRVGDLTGPLANITDSIVKLDAALAAAAIGVTGYAVKISDDFDTAFGEIATLIGQPADNLRDFQDQILSYSETSTASLDEITNATYSAISAGVDYKNSLEILAEAETLSIAGRADLGDTTRALVSTMNAFGASADEAGDYADNFFTAVQLGQTTIPELAASMGRLSPIAAAAGLSFEEMAAAIATITAETGTSTPEAITGLRAAISAIIGPSKQAADLAAELGIEFNGAALKAKGFEGVVKDATEATGGNTEALKTLFGGVEALAPVLALGGNAAEKFAENLLKFTQNTGAAKTASQELIDTLGLLGQTLVNNIESALIGVGGRLTDETRSIVKSLTSIFNSLGTEIKLDDGAFSPILNALEGLAQDIDQKLQTIAKNFPEALSGLDLTQLLDAFGDLGDELGDLFTGLFGDIDLSTVEGLESALQRVVDAFTALVQISSGIAQGLEPLFQAIGTGIEKFEDLDGATKKNIGELLGYAKTIDTILPAIASLGGGLEAIGTGLTALAGAQGFKAVTGQLETLKKSVSNVGKGGIIGTALIGFSGGYALGTWLNEQLEQALGGSLGVKIYEWLNEDDIQSVADQFGELTGEAAKTAKETAALREINDRLADSLDNTKQSAELDIDALNRRAAELVKNANAGEDVADSQRETTNALEDLTNRVSESGGALADVGETTRDLAKNNKDLELSYDDATGKVNGWSGTIVKSSKSMEDAAQKTKDLIEKTDEYELKLEEFASNERIAQISANVKINTAEIEAEANKAIAIIDGISDSVTSTGDVISDLFGQLGEGSRLDQFEVASQIRKENERRDASFKLQERYTNAQIELIKKKTDRLSKGDALIKVEADNLTPALELIFNEVLQRAQIRASEEGLEFLVGL